MSDPGSPLQSALPSPGLAPLEPVEDLWSRIERGNLYARSAKSRSIQ